VLALLVTILIAALAYWLCLALRLPQVVAVIVAVLVILYAAFPLGHP
jgi:hypothetical protein